MFLELDNISKLFKDGRQNHQVIKGLDFQLETGSSAAIMGRSGSGKSTLLNLIGGLLPVDEGEIRLNGEKLQKRDFRALSAYRRKYIGYVTQQFNLLDDRNVLENVMLPLRYERKNYGEIKRLAEIVLGEMGMERYAKKSVTMLSGGERQRVAIARAIIKEPALLLADEPTGALDEEAESSILEIFKQMEGRKTSLILVTHDASTANICREKYFLRDGILMRQ